MTVRSFGVDVKSTRLRHGTGQLRFGKRTGDHDATGEQKGEPHARSRHFLRKAGGEKTGPQHGGKRKDHQCFQADAAGQLNSFLDDHSNSPIPVSDEPTMSPNRRTPLNSCPFTVFFRRKPVIWAGGRRPSFQPRWGLAAIEWPTWCVSAPPCQGFPPKPRCIRRSLVSCPPENS